MSQPQDKINPCKKIFFINKELVKVFHINKSSNIVNFYNVTQGKEQSMLYSDFKKHRKRAYTIANTARLLNRSRVQFQRIIANGLIPAPIGDSIGGERGFQINAYYSEDHVFEIREIMTTVHGGRPRKDGKITPRNVLTEQDLRSRMGDAIMLYTKTSDGRFIPTWQEETW
jgi:hypothetical protein